MNPKKIDYVNELVMTFSTRKSLFSSKKLERFVVFIVFLSMTVAYLIINIRTMSAMEFVEVCALWLAYGGYNSFMNHKDKKATNAQSESTQTVDNSQNQSESTSGEEESSN